MRDMQFKVNGRVLDGGSMRIREVCEAEKALGIDAAAGGLGNKLAVALFVALRRADPERHPVEIADEVLDTDMDLIEEIDEGEAQAVPPPDSESPPISGPPLSAVSE